MRIIVLGSGAGGGFPQWNCNCPNCAGLRAGTIKARARTQSSLAVSDGGVDWLLINASPDLRAQLESCPSLQPARAVRDTAIAAVLVVDAQIDHSTGLMTLREHTKRLPVYCTPSVHSDLTTGYPLLSVLEYYCGVEWRPIDAIGGVPIEIPEIPGISLLPIPLPSEAPPYSTQFTSDRLARDCIGEIRDNQAACVLERRTHLVLGVSRRASGDRGGHPHLAIRLDFPVIRQRRLTGGGRPVWRTKRGRRAFLDSRIGAEDRARRLSQSRAATS